MIKQKRFKAHDNLIVDVIKRQSGSLGKAVLEAVMNSVDAGASQVKITLQADRLEVVDDGKGFQSEHEIDEYFATFGAPHSKDSEGEVTDAKYGEFRMGRGQLFAFGVNVWVTNILELRVDINSKGLDFEVHPAGVPHQGCRVKLDLYERLSATNLNYTIEEITRNCKYVEAAVLLNGRQINTPPEGCKWTEITDDAYIKVTDNSSKGIEFYQQGVYVQTIPTWSIGASGVIVTKQRVKLNFARNEVMRGDARFKRIIEKFKKDNEKRAQSKRDLTRDERRALLTSLRLKEAHWRDNLAAKLFPDTSGRLWSVNTLRRLPGQETYALTPSKKVGYCFAPTGDRRADRVMQQQLGLVFDISILDDYLSEPELLFQNIDYGVDSSFELVKLADLSKVAETSHKLLEPSKQTPSETRLLAALDSIQHDILRAAAELRGEQHAWGDQRVLRVGVSETNSAWTDGETYVAFNRACISKAGLEMQGITNLTHLFIHELAHDGPDEGTHEHNLEFYKLVHDIESHRGILLGFAARKAYTTLVTQIERELGKLDKTKRMEAMRTKTHKQSLELLEA